MRDEVALLNLRAGLIGVSLLAATATAAAQAPPVAPASSPATSSANQSTTAAAQPTPQVAAPVSPNPPAPTPNVTVPAGLAGMQGMKVASVELHSNVQLPPERLQELVAQKVNEPLDKNKVRRSLQALYATGRFADIQVDAQRAPQNQVSLVFVAQENYFVGFTWVENAPNPPTGDQLINASKLQLGELFTEQKLQDSLARMQRTMEANGYYQGKITAFKTQHANTQQMDIKFHVDRGQPARIGQVIVRGDPGMTVQEVESSAKLHPRDRVTVARTTKALQRLRSHFQKRDRLEAQVVLAQRVYHQDSNTLDYVFDITRGPTVDIHVEGAKLRKGKLKKYVPVYEENAVDADLLNEGRRNIRDYYQTQGYFDVEVNWKEEQEPQNDHKHVEYEVKLGPRHNLMKLDLEGNKYFDDDLLRERMLIQPKGILLSHGRFSETMLVRDKESIEAVYKANGFQQVKIMTEVQDDYLGKEGDMRVVFKVDEGPQSKVADLKVVGNTSESQDELVTRMNTLPGQPFSEFNLASDRDSIMNFYFNQGFPDVRVEPVSQPVDKDGTRMNVTFNIAEGERVYVDKVLLSGLEHTKGFVVGREFQLWDGDPLSQYRMLETQRRLYDLGIFNEVNMAVQNPDGQSNSKNLLVQMDEAKRWTFTYGAGLEVQTGLPATACGTDTSNPLVRACRVKLQNEQQNTSVSPRVTFGVTRNNFRGRNHTVVFKGNYGRLQKRALFSYEAPRLFDRENLKLTLSSFYDKSRDVLTFGSSRAEASTQVEQTLSHIDTLLYRLTFRHVTVDPNTLIISQSQIPLLSQPVRVGMPSLTYIRDKRDNPIETHKGNYTTADFGASSFIFGSSRNSNFNRLNVQNNTYQTFGKKKFVFARSTRVGLASSYGRSNLIPLPERFFAGGGNSHRGFAINGAGPRDVDTGTPLGGGGMFLNSFELRLPPLTLPFVEDNLSFVAFEDAGNVFNKPNDILHSIFRAAQPDKGQCVAALRDKTATCNFNYLAHAVGMGVRYKTPVGPVRFDLGYNLNPPTFPERSLLDPVTGQPICLNVNKAGNCTQVANPIRTLGHFNFFFSIGQTF